jgi:hypothetical protein
LPGIVVAPSNVTIPAHPSGTLHCNIVGVPAEDESAARSPSEDTGVSVAGGAISSAYKKILA